MMDRYLNSKIVTHIMVSLLLASNLQALTLRDVAEFEVDESNINVFATPVAVKKDSLYTVNVEPGAKNASYRKTVVRQYKLSEFNTIKASRVIDGKTPPDKYHTQGSIAVDKKGYVHLVYNMHNDPWKYSVSAKPLSIDSFDFRGESQGQPSAIPGTQITYPRFQEDRNGDLYLSYRFAVKPNKSFAKRAFGMTIVKLDLATSRWVPLRSYSNVEETAKLSGSDLALAYQDGMTAYFPSIFFDHDNGMHVTWSWRRGKAGKEMESANYLYRPDHKRFFDISGGAVSLPLSYDLNRSIIPANYRPSYALTSVWKHKEGNIGFLYHSIKKGRLIARFDGAKKSWASPEPSPFSASQVVQDDKGRLYAFASGPTVSEYKNGQWRVVIDQRDSAETYCHPKVTAHFAERIFSLHSQNCNNNKVKISVLSWDQ